MGVAGDVGENMMITHHIVEIQQDHKSYLEYIPYFILVSSVTGR